MRGEILCLSSPSVFVPSWTFEQEQSASTDNMADYGDYGRRRPRASSAAASGRAGPIHAASATAGGGQPRIVYRGRVSSSGRASDANASNVASANASKVGRARSAGRSHPWDDAAKNTNTAKAAAIGDERTGAGAGHGGGYGGGDYGGGGGYGPSRGGKRSQSRGGKGGSSNAHASGGGGQDPKLAAIRSASPHAPSRGRGHGRSSGRAASGDGGGRSSGNGDDLLARAGIQLSDRQRKLMERRRGGRAGNGGNAGAEAKTKSQTREASPKSKSSRRTSQSPMRRRSSSSSANHASRRSLAEVDGNSPVRGGGSNGAVGEDKKGNGNHAGRRATSRPSSRSPKRSSSSGKQAGLGPSTSSRGGTVPSTSSSSLARSRSVGDKRPPNGGIAASAATTPPRPRLARSASSRRSALGDLDGNSPKRGSMSRPGTGGGGGGSKRGLSKSPKRAMSKSPLRRSGSSASASRRSASVGRSSSAGGDRGGSGVATASAYASTSTSTLVVHEEIPGADADKVPTEEMLLPPPPTKAEGSKPAAAARPPKVPDRSASAPRGILRPPVYSQSKAGGTAVADVAEQHSSNIPSQPMAAVTSISSEAKAVPVPVAKPPKSSTVGDNAIDSDDEVDAGFNNFMNELMEEVAPDHTEVRCCFASFMYGIDIGCPFSFGSFDFHSPVEYSKPFSLPALGRLPVFIRRIAKVEAASPRQLQGRGV